MTMLFIYYICLQSKGSTLSLRKVPYLSVLDLQRAATRVDVCSVQWCFGPLGALHRVKCDDRVKDKTFKYHLTLNDSNDNRTPKDTKESKTPACYFAASLSVIPNKWQTTKDLPQLLIFLAVCRLTFSRTCKIVSECAQGSLWLLDYQKPPVYHRLTLTTRFSAVTCPPVLQHWVSQGGSYQVTTCFNLHYTLGKFLSFNYTDHQLCSELEK